MKEGLARGRCAEESLLSAELQSSTPRAVTAGKAFPQLSLMVTYGHYYHVFTIESTETANPRSGPGLSADLIPLYQAPQPLQMTPVQLNTEFRGILISGYGFTALCFTALYALHRHTSPGAASAGKGQLLLSGSLLTPTYFIKFPGRCFPVLPSLCPVLLTVGSKRTKC